jgi:hypothetical protein
MKVFLILAAILFTITQSAACPDCFVTQLCGPYKWTAWINRDRPSGVGDWEDVTDAVAFGGCKAPIWI